MAKTYSYDPANLGAYGKDRMRFELGDTTLNPGELTAALCDEEYEALIAQHPKWKKAKVKCLEAIIMRFAHQVTVSVDGLSYSFAERVNLWRELLKEAKREAATDAVPTADPASIVGRQGGPSYFYNDLHHNCRIETPNKRRR